MPQLLSTLFLALLVALGAGVFFLVRWLWRRGAPRHARVSASQSAAPRPEPEPMYPRLLNTGSYSRWEPEHPPERTALNALRSDTAAAAGTHPAAASRLTALSRIESLPPLKRALVWSELLGRPVSERWPPAGSR